MGVLNNPIGYHNTPTSIRAAPVHPLHAEWTPLRACYPRLQHYLASQSPDFVRITGTSYHAHIIETAWCAILYDLSIRDAGAGASVLTSKESHLYTYVFNAIVLKVLLCSNLFPVIAQYIIHQLSSHYLRLRVNPRSPYPLHHFVTPPPPCRPNKMQLQSEQYQTRKFLPEALMSLSKFIGLVSFSIMCSSLPFVSPSLSCRTWLIGYFNKCFWHTTAS